MVDILAWKLQTIVEKLWKKNINKSSNGQFVIHCFALEKILNKFLFSLGIVRNNASWKSMLRDRAEKEIAFAIFKFDAKIFNLRRG